MKFCLLALALTAGAFAGDVRHDKMLMLSKMFANPAIQSQILKDGFDFSSIEFEEADDGDTEPLYFLGTSNPKATPSYKCYSVYFDTDEPNVPAGVREVEAVETHFCR